MSGWTQQSSVARCKTIDEIVKDRADWVVDAVAGSTQNRAFLRGDPKEDEVATESIYLAAEKAIRIAIEHAIKLPLRSRLKPKGD